MAGEAPRIGTQPKEAWAPGEKGLFYSFFGLCFTGFAGAFGYQLFRIFGGG